MCLFERVPYHTSVKLEDGTVLGAGRPAHLFDATYVATHGMVCYGDLAGVPFVRQGGLQEYNESKNGSKMGRDAPA